MNRCTDAIRELAYKAAHYRLFDGLALAAVDYQHRPGPVTSRLLAEAALRLSHLEERYPEFVPYWLEVAECALEAAAMYYAGSGNIKSLWRGARRYVEAGYD